MTAAIDGETVRVVRVAGRHSIIVWQGKLKRVQARELEATRTEGSAVAT
jgi:hypothetical protein